MKNEKEKAKTAAFTSETDKASAPAYNLFVGSSKKATAPKDPPALETELVDEATDMKLSMSDRRHKQVNKLVKKQGHIAYRQLAEIFSPDLSVFRKRSRLGELLVKLGLITEEQRREALDIQAKKKGKSLGLILNDLGYLDETMLAMNIALQAGLPYISLEYIKIDDDALELFSQDLARKLEAVPIRLDKNRAILAVADPSAINVEELSFTLNRNISLAITTHKDLMETIPKLYERVDDLDTFLSKTPEIYLDIEKDEEESADTLVARGGEAPVIELVNKIIFGGVDKEASDIHIIPEKDSVRIYYRITGTMVEKTHLKKSVHNFVVARIKIISGMNITERRLPQDGRIHGHVNKQTVDIRVSTLPSTYGETVVLRIRYPDLQLPTMDDLGFSEKDLLIMRKAIGRSKGMILVTGPTGSGKSTTLASILIAVRDQPEKLHILTVEDPVEMIIHGVTQIPVNYAIGLTFPRVLRNVLRHDPDVVMVGEIRDQETVDIAIRAALTGHLVLSTLHTNDALGAVTRLLDMGVEPYLIGFAINLILAQRLVRVLCDCKEPYEPDKDERAFLESQGVTVDAKTRLYRASRCIDCSETGFKGRAMIYEMFELDKDIRALVAGKNFDSATIMETLLQKGFKPIINQGIDRLLKGETTLSEIIRHLE